MEDLGSVWPFVQILDLPVPQMMDQFAELLNLEEDVLDAGRLVDRYFQVPQLVIEVPKFIIEDVPMRTSVPEPQLAEQLVEVPTVLSPTRIALRIAEQIVDTPVPRGRGQGFLPEQSSIVNSSSFERISEWTVEQIVDIPSSGGGHGERFSSSAGPAEKDFYCFFRTFPH